MIQSPRTSFVVFVFLVVIGAAALLATSTVAEGAGESSSPVWEQLDLPASSATTLVVSRAAAPTTATTNGRTTNHARRSINLFLHSTLKLRKILLDKHKRSIQDEGNWRLESNTTSLRFVRSLR